MTQSQLPVGTYRISRLNGADTIERQPEVTLAEDGQVTGQASINRVMGEYTSAPDGIVFGRLATTMMAGSEEAMRQEAEVLRVLAGSCRVSATESGSYLLESDGGSAELEPVDSVADSSSTTPGATAGSAASVTIRGSVVYPQRIALSEAAVTRVTLEDISLADAPSTVLASAEITGGQVPIWFTLEAARDGLEGRTLSVRATIHEGDSLRWTTDTVHPVDLDDIPGSMMIRVVQVGEE